MEKNALDVALDTRIYRIFPLKRIIQALHERQLVLVKPASWDDPFENFLFKAKAMVGSEKVSLERLRERLYGQCWMDFAESDAMWRIYSVVPKRGTDEKLTEDVGVKVRSTVGNLFSALYNSGRSPELCYWVGRVGYLTQQQMDELAANNDLMSAWLQDGTARGHAQSLLLKRDPFSHEREVRLIYDANNGCDFTKQAIYPFQIDPNGIFEEIILDPRLSEEHCKELGEALRKAEYKGPISQSSLYLPPQYTVTIG